MKTRALLTIPLALLLSSGAQAQQWYWGMSYGVSFTISDTKDFTDDTSWRNWGVDLLAIVNPNTTVGVSFNWNVFNEITPTVSSISGIEIAGTQFRFINSLPFLVTFREYLGTPGGARPFIGVGVGPHLVKQRVDVGLFTISENTWHFGVAPEVGLLMPLGPTVSWFADVKYNYAASAGDPGRKHSYFAFNLGFAWEVGGNSF